MLGPSLSMQKKIRVPPPPPWGGVMIKSLKKIVARFTLSVFVPTIIKGVLASVPTHGFSLNFAY